MNLLSLRLWSDSLILIATTSLMTGSDHQSDNRWDQKSKEKEENPIGKQF